jgi:GT2 family glycosyltransferase
MNIAVIITCHNRKNKTSKCLKILYSQAGIGDKFNLIVFLTDDGSTDGTSESIKLEFPEVNILKGNGNLFWNRGMILAWEAALKNNDYDYYLLLNDDTFLLDNTILNLLSYNSTEVIICGSSKSEIEIDKLTYGGYSGKHTIYPNNVFQKCDYASGNILLVSNFVVKKIGILDKTFHHALGDYDYTLRANINKIDVLVCPGFCGICELHDSIPLWRSGNDIFIRILSLYSPISGCSPNEFFIFDLRHKGLLIAVLHFITIHLRAIFKFN